MRHEIIDKTPEIWGEQDSTERDAVEPDYEKIIQTGAYDETFAQWDDSGPQSAAAIVRNSVPLSSIIMDAARGSCLTDAAFRNLGYSDVHWIDISLGLLKLAEKTGVHSSLRKVDMQELPLPIEDSISDAVNCIGALT